MSKLKEIKKEVIENGLVYEVGYYVTEDGKKIGHYKLFLRDENAPEIEPPIEIELEPETTLESLQEEITQIKEEVSSGNKTSNMSQEFLIGVMENMVDLTEKIDGLLEEREAKK